MTDAVSRKGKGMHLNALRGGDLGAGGNLRLRSFLATPRISEDGMRERVATDFLRHTARPDAIDEARAVEIWVA